MKYYVVSDVHGFFSLLKQVLQEKGFFEDKEPHKLILCGDMLDRGKETIEMQEFMLNLLHNNELIFVRGNHEDLMIDMLDRFENYRWEITLGVSHHNSNGTWDSALQLSRMDEVNALRNTQEFIYKVSESGFYKELIPASVDYFETENYIFVHGWIPCFTEDMPAWSRRNRHYKFNPGWRSSSKKEWDLARWFNGMELSELRNIVEHGKRIVCGHWHTSYGHCWLENKCSEFGEDADFSPYYGKNIIAIDACTAHSGKVNCLVIED